MFGFLKKKHLEDDKYGALVEWYRQWKTQFLANILTLNYFMVKIQEKAYYLGIILN